MELYMIFGGHFASYQKEDGIKSEEDLIKVLNGLDNTHKYLLKSITLSNKTPGIDLENVADELDDRHVRQIFMKDCMRRRA